MQIGMATTLPRTPEQIECLKALAITLARAADQAEAYKELTRGFGIVIEARNATDFLDAASQQLMNTANWEASCK